MAKTEGPPPVPLLRQKCPNCGKNATLDFRPFCSKRCADVDLGRWLNEDYRIAGDEAVSNEESFDEGDH
ncbi:MAG: DNA gyrase inhibitor YacG [Rhodospirillales bacterium]|nr:DNA gyrase inhibitor YacG [Rhodospirillales bacterium]